MSRAESPLRGPLSRSTRGSGPLTPAVPPSVAASEWGSSFRRGVRIGRCPRRRRGRRRHRGEGRRRGKGRHRGKGRRANTLPANPPQPEAIPAVAPAPVQLRCRHDAAAHFARRTRTVRLPLSLWEDNDNEPIAFCGHPRRVGSGYCTPHFHLTRGVGTAAQRAAGPVMLRLVEAA
jgi:GcrA cell cycle regulator